MMSLVNTLENYPLKTISVDGVIQGYREAGNGKNYLVLLHGISSGSGSWVYQLQHLSQDFHVIAWDAPGYHRSDNLPISQVTAIDYAQRLKQLLDALGISQAIVVGHSLGALQATAFASCYPNMVKKLVLANLAQGYGNADPKTQEEVFQKRPTILKQLGAKEMALQRGPNLLFKKEPPLLAVINEVMNQLTLTGFSNASYLLAYDDITAYLSHLNMPCYVIVGEKDTITPKAGIQMLTHSFNLTNFYVIPEAGHLSYLDQPQIFNSLIQQISKEQT